MIATATPRRPPTQPCTLFIIGQVDTTIIVAQSIAPTNGSSTQRLPARSRPMARTDSTVRVRSGGASWGVVAVVMASSSSSVGPSLGQGGPPGGRKWVAYPSEGAPSDVEGDRGAARKGNLADAAMSTGAPFRRAR